MKIINQWEDSVINEEEITENTLSRFLKLYHTIYEELKELDVPDEANVNKGSFANEISIEEDFFKDFLADSQE